MNCNTYLSIIHIRQSFFLSMKFGVFINILVNCQDNIYKGSAPIGTNNLKLNGCFHVSHKKNNLYKIFK